MKACACFCLDEHIRKASSSGGIYPLIAELIIQKNGVVYAACFDSALEVRHRRIDNVDDIRASQGSKYVASHLGDTFFDVEADLLDGKRVLFSGLPCQCAGLNAYIEAKKIDRSQLTLVDCVCHGIPGRVPWRAYLTSMKKRGFEITDVNMRNKSTGWTQKNYAWLMKDSSNREEIVPWRHVEFMKGMVANLYIRPSCFECHFKGIDRVSDLTLGDYWGVWDQLPEMDDNRGTSLVLIHSPDGEDVFRQIENRIKLTDAVFDRAVTANPCIVESTHYNPQRKEFYKRLNRGDDFIQVVSDLTKAPSFLTKLKRKLRRILLPQQGDKKYV